MVARRTKVVLKVVVGAGQVGHRVAVEQARPVASGHLEEVWHRSGQRPSGVSLPGHFRQQPKVSLAEIFDRTLFVVGQQVGGPVHPGVGGPNIGPEWGGGGKSPTEEGVQAC